MTSIAELAKDFAKKEGIVINPELLKELEKPKTHNDVLDNPETLKNVDLLNFLDDNHLLKKLCIAVSAAFHLPESTVFLVVPTKQCRFYFINKLAE